MRLSGVKLQIAQVGRVEVLRVGLTPVVPQDAARGTIDTKVHVRQVLEVSPGRIEDVGRAGNAITQAKSGLVVTRLRLLYGE